MNIKDRASRLRLEICRRQERLGALLNELKGASPSMIRGSVYTRRRRCGKPRCRCVRGHPHRDRVLAVQNAGRVSVRSLDPAADTAVEQAVAAWQGFRRQRGELVAGYQSLLRVVDRLAGLRVARVRKMNATPTASAASREDVFPA